MIEKSKKGSEEMFWKDNTLCAYLMFDIKSLYAK